MGVLLRIIFRQSRNVFPQNLDKTMIPQGPRHDDPRASLLDKGISCFFPFYHHVVFIQCASATFPWLSSPHPQLFLLETVLATRLRTTKVPLSRWSSSQLRRRPLANSYAFISHGIGFPFHHTVPTVYAKFQIYCRLLPEMSLDEGKRYKVINCSVSQSATQAPS